MCVYQYIALDLFFEQIFINCLMLSLYMSKSLKKRKYLKLCIDLNSNFVIWLFLIFPYLPDAQVSWIQRRDWHIMSVGGTVFTTDDRVQVRRNGRQWYFGLFDFFFLVCLFVCSFYLI